MALTATGRTTRMNQVEFSTLFEGIKTMARSFMENGKFVLPQLSPSCFGLAVHYRLTAEDIAPFEKSAEDFEEIMNRLGIGDEIECGTLVISDKPYKKRGIGKRKNSREMDTARPNIRKAGKPGSEERLNALRAFYAKRSQDDLLSCDEFRSPFIVDIADAIAKSEIGKMFTDYDTSEKSAEVA